MRPRLIGYSMAPAAGSCCDGAMDDYGPATYGEHVADVYDEWYSLAEPDAECALLADLAAGGRVLELGIGTGRVALPLAASGVDVYGIDTSPAIVAKMRAKPGGDAIPVTIGDMADVAVDGDFSLVFVVFNTLFMLTTKQDQERCFRNVAARLEPGGRFLVHVFVPDTSRIERGENLTVKSVGVDSVRLDATLFDAGAQRIDTTQIRIAESGIRLVHARIRFAFPPELDQMARLAGLELEARWGSFTRDAFTDDSPIHVSVYRRPPE
jgi:SAM-dependent methyltransferase